MNLNSHQFEEVYGWLGINLDALGCIMLDLDPIQFPDNPPEFYTAKNESRFWIKGWVAGKTPHLTLLYGLLEDGKNFEPHISKVLEGWELGSVEIEKIGYFDSPYPDEPYFCIVAHIKVTPELLEGHQRLEFLPHINTFTGYKPHFTLGYIVKDEESRDLFIERLTKELVGKKLTIREGVNLGGKKE